MRHAITIFTLLNLFTAQAQEKIDTLFYDASWSETDIKENIQYYRLAAKAEDGYDIVVYYIHGGVYCTGLISSLDSEFRIGYFRFYDKGWKLKCEGNYKNNKQDGLWKTYYYNKKIKWEINYSEGKYHGKLISYYPTGNKKREDNYEMDSLKSGECFSETGENVDFYKFETMPKFPGGDDSLMRYLMYNVKYPKVALKKEIEGQVLVNFVINIDGSIGEVKVKKSINPMLDEEAVRLVKLMPLWQAGMQDGKAVPVHFDLPINFVLE